MRKLTFISLVALCICACNTNQTENTFVSENIDTSDVTNDFYDNETIYSLPVQPIQITGEIENPGEVDFSSLPLRTVIVKETILSEDDNQFIGAYRYDGYSLYDILNQVKLHKKNFDEFNRIIDMYVQIENEAGEKVNISWGEIYYPNHLHEIIIATKVMRIVPSKTDDLWELPEKAKVIVSSDLITERNILNPVKITVKSYPKFFVTVKGLKPLYSATVDLYNENELVETLTQYPDNMQIESFETIFYGRGRGIHSTKPFTGVLLKQITGKYAEFNQKNIREGIFLVVAKDGYRSVFTFSELMNRNDQSEVLFLYRPKMKHNGAFRLFPACDFFSDRAIKGINAIYFSANEK